MRFFKNVFSQLHTFVLWALMSAIFWGWIFTLVTDAPPAKKITVYCYVPEIRDTELAVLLEEDKPDGIKMIQVHNFEYVLFDMGNIENGDIFILPASQIGEYEELLLSKAAGVKVYDAKTHTGAAASYLGYTDEDYYLFLGAKSVHLEDGAAQAVTDALLAAP